MRVCALWTAWFFAQYFLSSEAFLVSTSNQRWLSPALFTSLRSRSSSTMTRKTSDKDYYDQDDNPKNKIVVSSDIELPVPANIAYDAFANLPRQPTWSPWLQSVEYINDKQDETKWKMKYLGLSVSWNAISTRQERPNIIEWKSTSGLQNFGRVHFKSIDDKTYMTMTMTFVAPKFIVKVCGRGSRLSKMVENRMIKKTLANFRDVVVNHDFKEHLEREMSAARY